jgi:hypothetical protein
VNEKCDIEGCLCQVSVQPITEVLYGDKFIEERRKRARRPAPDYEPRGHRAAMWRRLDLEELNELAERFPKARRFVSRRQSA